ncbi:MAG: hypothetical protein N4A40_16680 [Tissierellales bacterium]|nr:hypothetical protein [Tissierellales bacterium]
MAIRVPKEKWSKTKCSNCEWIKKSGETYYCPFQKCFKKLDCSKEWKVIKCE